MSEARRDVDLGHGHRLRFFSWAPDRKLNPQYAGIPDVPFYGAFVYHPRHRKPGDLVPWADDGECVGAVMFDGIVQRRVEPTRPMWKVECMSPLTLTPSLLCSCGDHGFIKQGKWVPA